MPFTDWRTISKFYRASRPFRCHGKARISDKTSCVCFPVQTSNYRQRHDRRPLQACDRPLVSDPSDAMHIRSNLSATQTGFLIGRPALVSGHALHRPIARLGARESLPRRPLGRFASPRHVDCSSLMINALFETILHIVYIRPHVGTTPFRRHAMNPANPCDALQHLVDQAVGSAAILHSLSVPLTNDRCDFNQRVSSEEK